MLGRLGVPSAGLARVLLGPLLTALAFATAFVSATGCSGNSVVTCESSRECSGLVCDRTLGQCVECVTSADCLVSGEVCRANRCDAVTRCVSSRECPGLVCDPARGYCVECVNDVDCLDGDRCDGEGFCETPPPPCTSDRMCSELGLVCDTEAGECVECVSNLDCGAGLSCVQHMCRTGPGVDAGPRRDAGPIGIDAGPRVDGGPLGLDAGPRVDGGPLGVDAGPMRTDAGPLPGTDAGPACLPGSLIIAFDRSGSMADAPSGDTPASPAGSRWGLARSAVNTWLAGLPPSLRAGLVLFPEPAGADACVLPSSATVPVAPLSSNRTPISVALTGTPEGGTPLLAALDVAYELALATSEAAPRAVLVITDGDDSCENPMAATILARVATMRAAGIRTYVLSLSYESNQHSKIALDGGTRTSSTCTAACNADQCATNADCGGTTTCTSILIPGTYGQCECSATALCPSGLTCGPNPLPLGAANVCSGNPDCCSHHVRTASFTSDLASSLNLVGADFISSCP